MNRKLLVVVAVAAALALVAGAAVGRNLLSSANPPTRRADVVRFKDEISKVSIAYPATWTLLPNPADDPEVALLVAADASTSLLLRVTRVGLETVTKETLPIVRKFTDGLLSEDSRAKQLYEPEPVELGGLPGYRYRYTYGSRETGGAHDHYFLFKGQRMIQLVFQAIPAASLNALLAVFDRIAATFKGNEA